MKIFLWVFVMGVLGVVFGSPIGVILILMGIPMAYGTSKITKSGFTDKRAKVNVGLALLGWAFIVVGFILHCLLEK